MKILDGKQLADYIKNRQADQVAGLARKPKLVIVRDSDNPVIVKYVQLKQKYGEDIGVEVADCYARDDGEIAEKIAAANDEATVDGIILQLPIRDRARTDDLTNLIAPSKDVDGLGQKSQFESATATAILWLLAGYDIDLRQYKIALVGKGKLVGAPLLKMFSASNLDVKAFSKGDDLAELKKYNLIISATGVPGLIKNEMIVPGAVVVDAGTASEDGVLVGDLAAEVHERTDLAAITPSKGGVGPLTVTCLFEHVLQASLK